MSKDERSGYQPTTLVEKVSDRWDYLTARLSIRFKPVRRWYIFWGILRDRRSFHDAYVLARSAK